MSIKKFYLLIICIFVKNSAQITLKKPTDAELVNYIKKVAAATMQQYQIPGMAIALYVHGKPYLFQFGFADKNKKLPVVATTIFEIGSITKIFTCLLLAQEVIDERMRLSDPIDVYIPTLSRNKKLQTITLEKLATHTSSLPLNAPPQIKTSEALRTHILHWQPVSGAPLSWQYSNHGIELLRIALEESLHKSFDQLVIDRILIPLGMSPIGTKISKDYQHDAAVGYDKPKSRLAPPISLRRWCTPCFKYGYAQFFKRRAWLAGHASCHQKSNASHANAICIIKTTHQIWLGMAN